MKAKFKKIKKRLRAAGGRSKRHHAKIRMAALNMWACEKH